MNIDKHFKKRNYSKEQLIIAVSTSTSIRETLLKLNIKAAGGNYKCFHNLIQELNIDTSHFLGHGNNKGKTFSSKRPIEDYLNNKQPIQSYKLKNRLIKDKIFKHECSCCKLINWNNLPIPLELDHINGNHNDNSLVNLRLLCPNCHAQTDNYRGKNIK